MQPEDEIRIGHLVDAAKRAMAHAQGRQRTDLDEDELLRLGLTKLVEIVGEAAKQVGPETRAAYPTVPWSAAARMRDRLIHHYFDINLDILWTTVKEDLPGLVSALEPVVAPPGEDEDRSKHQPDVAG